MRWSRYHRPASGTAWPGRLVAHPDEDLGETPSPGAYVLQNYDELLADGSYNVFGSDATLTIIPEVGVIHAGDGSYAVTGTDNSLKHGWKIAAAAGSYVVTGSDATLTLANNNKTIAAGAGSHTQTSSHTLLKKSTFNHVFGAANWNTISVAVTDDTTAGPDGNSTADTLTASAGNAKHELWRPWSLSTSTNYALSVFVKKGTHRYFHLSFAGNGGHFVAAIFDLDGGGTTATETAVGGTSGTIVSTRQTAESNSWYKLTLTGGNFSDVADDYIQISMAGAATGNSFSGGSSGYGEVTFNAAGTETVHLWGFGIETV